MNNFLKDFLLLKSTNIDNVLMVVKEVSFPILSLTFMMGAVFENYGQQNFIGLFKRLIIALFLIPYGSVILKESVNLSFDISSRIMSSSQKNNPVIQLIDRARKISQQEKPKNPDDKIKEKIKNSSNSLWESTAFVTKLLLDDGMSSVIFVISYTALLILGQFYTIVYNFTYVSIPIIATLIVFPPTYSVANSISRTISWVFLMPIFCMITILLLSLSFAFPQDGANEFYFTTFENLINFCIMAIMLLLVPTIVSGFLSGSGILTAAETFSKTTAMAVATGGKGLIFKSGKSIGQRILFGKDNGLVTMGKVGVNRGLHKLGDSSIGARKRLDGASKKDTAPLDSGSKNQGVSQDIAQNSAGRDLRNNPQGDKNKNNSSSKVGASFLSKTLDRSIVATDSVLNYKKNKIASKAVKADMKKMSENSQPGTRLSLFNQYKKNAHKDAFLLRPIDYKVSKIRRENPHKGHQSSWVDKKGEGIYGKNKYRGRRA